MKDTEPLSKQFNKTANRGLLVSVILFCILLADIVTGVLFHYDVIVISEKTQAKMYLIGLLSAPGCLGCFLGSLLTAGAGARQAELEKKYPLSQ